ncbi:MAG: hypothetical protein ACE5FJ_04860 [Gemmatimonadales bacterium]
MRKQKFRQAAFVYLHVAILYEGAAYQMMRHDMLPHRFGPPILWLLAGATLAGGIVWGLLKYQNVWFARVVWAVHGLRIPALIKGAFFAGGATTLLPSFYVAALVAVMINLWMLARAAWDL